MRPSRTAWPPWAAGAPTRRRLGVGLRRPWRGSCVAVGLEERDGLLVREVEDDSPAAKAGVAEGDLIVAAAGKPVTSADDLFDAIGSVGAKDALELTLLRGTEERTVTIPRERLGRPRLHPPGLPAR